VNHPERIVPEHAERGIVAIHLKRYEFAQPFCVGKEVLDAGCGVGYGTAHLASVALRVVGVDVSADAIEHARARYAAPNTEFVQGDALELPFEDESFDVVCSFETIEHVRDAEALVAELRRVLRRGGTCVLSTPRVEHTTHTPDNPFHVVELSPRDFEALLRQRFDDVELYGQRRRQTSRHRALQRLDVLGVRKHLTFLRPASRLLGTPPMAEVALDDIAIERSAVAGATEVIAVCR
jgi:O-antigen biosynthesis protein